MVGGVLQTHVVRVADKRLAAAEVEVEVDQSAREDVEVSCGDVAHAVCAVEHQARVSRCSITTVVLPQDAVWVEEPVSVVHRARCWEVVLEKD